MVEMSQYERTSTDILIIICGLLFVILGTGGFIAYILVASRKQITSNDNGGQEKEVDDMPLLSDLDMFPMEHRKSEIQVNLFGPQLVRRETPLLERCGSSTISDYQFGDELELRPHLVPNESQRFNIQMRSSQSVERLNV